MSEPSAADWRVVLDRIDRAVRECLTELGHHEGRHAAVIRDEPAPPRRASPLPASDGWDDRLAAVGKHAADAERELAVQEAEWGRWHAVASAVRRSLEQPPG